MNHKDVYIHAIAQANPEHCVDQSIVQDYASTIFETNPDFLERLLPVFANTGIQQRYFSTPIEWFSTEHTFAQTNQIFLDISRQLLKKITTELLETTGIASSEIQCVIVASSTGIATPSLDSYLILDCGLESSTKRIPVWGLGCAAGVSGLAHAATIAQHFDTGYVLFACVELCSLTFQKNDLTKSNIIASSLFGDGAAGVLLSTKAPVNKLQAQHVRIKNSASKLFVNTQNIMGWDIIDSGLKVRFSRDIPTFIQNEIPSVVNNWYEQWGIEKDAIVNYVMHPGGTKVLSAYSQAFTVEQSLFDTALHVLTNYGNMSSCSVLFVLKHALTTQIMKNGLGLMMALGPGFSAEGILLETTPDTDVNK